MFGLIKKALVASAIVAAGPFAAPAMADATGTWTTGGAPFSGSMAAAADGSLTYVHAGSALELTCDVTLDMTVTNPDGHVTVSGASFEGCETNIEGCDAEATATGPTGTLPWTGTGVAATQTLNFAAWSFDIHFGDPCPQPLSGLTITVTGSLSPEFDEASQLIRFDGTASTGTLTSPLGTGFFSGDLQITAPQALELT